jgi:threonine/homoserine/homoserine lactone efflux protein
MLPLVILGATYGFAAAVQPGPFQAYLVSSTLSQGLRRTLPALLAPLLSDIPIISLILLVLTRVPPQALNLLRTAGGVFLLYLAAGAFAAFRAYRAPQVHQPSQARQTLFKAAVVNLLNPNPYISWSLILGPLLLDAWRAAPAHAIGLLVSFYATMMATTALMLVPFAGARALGPTIGRAALGASALALAAFGVYQVWAGGSSLVQGLP